MKAIILQSHGDASNLVLTEVPIPVAKVGEVLIKVMAVAINPSDTYIRKEVSLDYIFGGDRPRIMGWDVSGVVVTVGEGVDKFKVGDEVFGAINFPGHNHAGHGKGYAEFATAPVTDLALKPANISFEEAAGATMAALTAWQPLSNAGIKPGDRVLIAPAGGGVGHYAVQIAKYFGAYVIAIASPRKRDFVLSLGADEVIDYTTQRFEDVISPVDVVLDGLRGDHIARSLTVVKPGGRLITLYTPIAGTPLEKLANERGVNAYYNTVHGSGEDMEKLAGLLASGEMKSHVSKTFRLEETADAHREMELDNAQGKIVVSLQE
jgi:NADPH:quinone reductase-like Zn-dependent oxidoreductase